MSGPAQPELVHICSKCGATIYPEHLHRGLARLSAGKMLCHHCLQDAAAAPPAPAIAPAAASAPSSPSASASGLNIPPIELEDEDADFAPIDVPALSATSLAGTSVQPAMPSMPAGISGRSVSRVHTFHSKLSEGAVRHMETLINEWLAQNPQVEVKFATTTVGMWEGKHAEPNLILTIFY